MHDLIARLLDLPTRKEILDMSESLKQLKIAVADNTLATSAVVARLDALKSQDADAAENGAVIADAVSQIKLNNDAITSALAPAQPAQPA